MVNYSGTYATPRPDLGAAYQEYMDSPDMAQFIADAVCPIVESAVQAGNFSRITRESALASASAERAPGAGYSRIEIGAEDDSFSTKEYGLEAVVDDRQRRLYQSDFDHEAATLRQVIRRLKTQREIRVAALIQNTTTWSGSALYTDNSGTPWSTVTTDVIGQILAAKEKVRAGTGMPPNSLVLSEANLQNLLKNDGIRNRFPGAELITEAMIRGALASIFGLQKLIVGGAVKNTADEGQTASLSDIWSQTYVMVCRTAMDRDPIDEPCVARTALWVPESPTDLLVETYREEQVRGEVLRARHDLFEKVRDAAQGHLMKVA
jgi:hypothetical protein